MPHLPAQPLPAPRLENSHRKFREAVLAMLFALMNPEQDEETLMKSLMFRLKIPKEKARQASARAKEILQVSAPLVERLSRVCLQHRWDRVGKLEQAVLILGAFELEFNKLDKKVVFAEAARLAAKFSTDKGAQFVHAVLDGFLKDTAIDASVDWQDPQVGKLSEELEQGAKLEVHALQGEESSQEADDEP